MSKKHQFDDDDNVPQSPDIDVEAYQMKFNFLKAQYDQETKDWQEKE